VAAALAACGGGGSSAPSSSAGPTGTTVTSSINSAQAGMTYALDMWLPPGYAQSPATYPVVYATDCEYRFLPLTLMLQLRADRGATPVILVNICAGPSEQCFLDFTMPGAAPYFAFLTKELIPYIDATYRTNPANRILSGHSLSGEFVMYALYLEDPAHRYFSSFVSGDGSLWFDSRTYQGEQYGPAVDMELAMYNAGRNLPVNLVLAGGIYSNGPHVAALYATIAGQSFQNLRLIQTSYALPHVPMDAPSFNDAMTFIFGD
jgi:enterochelin esterase-like enzyme